MLLCEICTCRCLIEQQHLIKCTGFIVKINLNNIYFLPLTIDPGQLTPVSNFCF